MRFTDRFIKKFYIGLIRKREIERAGLQFLLCHFLDTSAHPLNTRVVINLVNVSFLKTPEELHETSATQRNAAKTRKMRFCAPP